MSEHNEAWMDRLIAAGVALDESKPDELVWTSNALDEALPGYYRGHWRKAINADPTLSPGEDWRVIDGDELRALKLRSDIAQPPASSLWIADKAAIDRLITAHVPDGYTGEVDPPPELEMEREHASNEEQALSTLKGKLREVFEPKHEEPPQFGTVRASICALASQAAQARVAIERRRDELLTEVNTLNEQIQWLRSFEAHCD